MIISIRKIFTGENVVDSFILNLMGIQPFRYLVAKILYFIKIFFFNFNKSLSIEFKELQKEGFQIKKNFLNNNEFNDIKNEYEKIISDEKFFITEKQSSTETKRGIDLKYVYIDERLRDEYPNLYNFKNNKYIRNFFEYAEQKKKINIQCRLERIEILTNDLPDTNKDYHYDTYYNTFKCWFFVKNVSSETGPFRFIAKSHLFNLKRLFTEWLNSIKSSFDKSLNTSFREKVDKKKFLDSISKEAVVEKNSLVMANTHGLHRRGDGKVGSVRYGIQFWTRENPFKVI